MGIDNPLPDSWGIGKLGVIGKARWPRWDEERFNELLVRFDVPAKAYSSLSRGQKSAVGFIFAVASGCEVMLLDEPYLGLDAQRRELFYQVLREEYGRTIVISTHHLNEVAGLLDTVSLMGITPFPVPLMNLSREFLSSRAHLRLSTQRSQSSTSACSTGKPQAWGPRAYRRPLYRHRSHLPRCPGPWPADQ